ncbi:MAG: sporulation protein, partial [Oscillospiraceae bacterium]|nr:sporulation protein [Oscillospiraceae bacterium]
MNRKAAGAAALCLVAALLLFPESAAGGARAGIYTCLTVLIPSLYPFLVITVFLIKSGLSSALGR